MDIFVEWRELELCFDVIIAPAEPDVGIQGDYAESHTLTMVDGKSPSEQPKALLNLIDADCDSIIADSIKEQVAELAWEPDFIDY